MGPAVQLDVSTSVEISALQKRTSHCNSALPAARLLGCRLWSSCAGTQVTHKAQKHQVQRPFLSHDTPLRDRNQRVVGGMQLHLAARRGSPTSNAATRRSSAHLFGTSVCWQPLSISGCEEGRGTALVTLVQTPLGEQSDQGQFHDIMVRKTGRSIRNAQCACL